MNRQNLSVAVIPFLLAILGAGLSGCSSERRAEPVAAETISDVATVAVHKTNVPDAWEAVGTIRAAQTSLVASQMMGNVIEVRAREGDRVQAGQVLATIDDAQPRAAVEQATAAVTSAEKEVSAADADATLAASTLKRYQQLYEKKSVSPQEFDEIQAREQSSRARRDMARAQQAQANAALVQARNALGYAQIHAPFSGVVTEKRVDAGTLASPGMPLFTLEDTQSYRLEVTADESDIRLVRIGQAVPVVLDTLGNAELAGKVTQIVPAADPASHSFLVKIGLAADGQLHSGLFGRARFSRGERAALLIPHSAIVDRGQLQGVYVIDANRMAGLHYVTLGRISGQQIEVLSGLQDGEVVILAPGNREWSGKRIASHP